MNICALFDLRWPVIQAPMAGAQGLAMALAARDAGALGSLPAALLDAAALRRSLGEWRDAGGGPLNVNVFCHRAPPAGTDIGDWQRALQAYWAEWQLAGDPPAGPGRAAFDAALLEALASAPPRVLSCHFGLPSADLLAGVRALGCQVIASATSVAEAQCLCEHGVDAVIAQGLGAGGHQGHFLDGGDSPRSDTLTLVAAIAAAVDRPVIAAGGIHDAASARAAMRAGAAGVQVGSALLCSPEATISALHRAAIRDAGPGQTALTRVFSGRPARGLQNRLMRELGDSPAIPPFPLAAAPLGPLRAAAEAAGDAGFSPLWCGVEGHRAQDRPAGEIIAAIAPRSWLSPTDGMRLRVFDALDTGLADFDHRAHLLHGYALHLRDGDRAGSVLRERLIALLRRGGFPLDKYHATVTAGWLGLIAEAVRVGGPYDGGEAFVDDNPLLFEADLLHRHYSPALLASDRARARVLPPDRAPLSVLS